MEDPGGCPLAGQDFDHQADLAHKQAKNTFVLPGIGKLVLVERPSRKMIMRFGEKAGQEGLRNER